MTFDELEPLGAYCVAGYVDLRHKHIAVINQDGSLTLTDAGKAMIAEIEALKVAKVVEALEREAPNPADKRGLRAAKTKPAVVDPTVLDSLLEDL